MQNRNTILVLFILLLFVLTSCSSGNKQETLPNGDTIETTASIHDLPEILTTADGGVKSVYALALEHQDIMKQVPVYDGSPYNSVLEAFFYKVNADGSLAWNSHGMTSGKAIAVATDVITMKDAGKSADEIKQEVKKKYEGEYGADSPKRTYKP
ncbi:PCYCGC motif-containing (lipo)protein [Aneurinibacillus tyrosinisolvens]|uniref:PCYCGC motif-containing (lipo)protein n=1 Tax=Aneurinibacillus tyrosinisolvens TaxID=1443435 RepID=UPI00069968BF|nr:PCYCGC motif-containing (lipo)protein [Aneurinibacillus tyrosinisolvens]